MKAHLIGFTQFNAPLAAEVTDGWQAEEAASAGEALIEFAGRACFESWRKPNPATRLNGDYVRNIAQKRHFSVMEHAAATFYIVGVSRSFTHELIRHRHLSYSERSQRYVNVENAGLVVPPAILQDDDRAFDVLAETGLQTSEAYRELVDRLTLQGLSHKQAREAARAVMPNMTETRIVVTGNLRAWRGFLELRGTEDADAEMCRVAVELGGQLKQTFPAVFADMHLEERDNRTVIVFA